MGRHTPRRCVSILIMCFGVNRRRNGTQSNLVFAFQTEKPMVRAQRIFDNFFNVFFGVSVCQYFDVGFTKSYIEILRNTSLLNVL